MSFCALPVELILEICSYLPQQDVVKLGLKTCNQHLYSACKTPLERIATTRRFQRRMKARFSVHWLCKWPCVTQEDYHKLRLDNQIGPYRENSSPSGDVLEPFEGDLPWLRASNGFPSWQRQRRSQYSNAEQVDRLQAQAADLGVEIPTAFLTFMANEELQLRLESVNRDNRVLMSSCLRKCVPSIQRDDSSDAYVLRFIRNPYGDGYACLYLDTGPEKGHCVIASYTDPDDPICDDEWAEYQGPSHSHYDPSSNFSAKVCNEMHAFLTTETAKMAWMEGGDLALLDHDFEEWLAKEYMRGKLELCAIGSAALGPAEMEYVCHNFTCRLDLKG